MDDVLLAEGQIADVPVNKREGIEKTQNQRYITGS